VGLRRAIATRLKAKGIKLAPYPWPWTPCAQWVLNGGRGTASHCET
jgi:hypothetical protein